ncbi:SMI1/KNR4 family protein [Streptomyces mayteni]
MWKRTLRIGGLVVPPPLTELIRSGRWVPPRDDRVLAEVFGEAPEQPEFYGRAMLVRQNTSWQALPADQVAGIDTARTIVIGDLGPDMPFVLDYRTSPDDPRVLYLGGPGDFRWRQVAANVGELIDRLCPG